ncbi:anthrone oxygenase family protein [Phycicoccus avicenniae]|uniref:anthrone oxygenase family protein n=1 Tax=Phycicoccus avicenniae TaxID=2828860 RepID=UPI003D2DD9B6
MAARLLLLAATVCAGLVAGVYLFYAHTVLPALRAAGDTTFVAAYAALDRRIVNPWFLLTSFLGAPLLAGAALAVTWGDPAAPWVAAALVLHLVTTAVTAIVHLPRNDRLKALAGDPASTAAARAALEEHTWVRWNLVRVATSVGALACVAWGLTLA